MIHNDGTMDVRVNGQMERRAYHVIRDRLEVRENIPAVQADERIYHVIGSDVPNILKSEKWSKWPI